MKKFLLLALLLGLPSPLFASSSTSGYKMKESCESDTNEYYYSLWKKNLNLVNGNFIKVKKKMARINWLAKGNMIN